MSSVIENLLNSQHIEKTLSTSLKQIKQDELSVLVIKHKTCVAALSLQGAHLLFWQPKHTQTPVIWLSEKTLFKQGTAARGGIPICWPWFNKLGGQPSHGFARIAMWQLIEHNETEDHVSLTLLLEDSPTTRQIWDHAFKLILKVQFGETCRVELESQGNYQATAALHSYFGIKDINQVVVSHLGDTYKESLDTINKPKKAGEMTFNQAVDRIYTSPEKTTPITDTVRTIKVTHLNASDVVVWSPWSEGAIAMKDMDDDGYKTMVCVETGRITKPMVTTTEQTDKIGLIVEVN